MLINKNFYQMKWNKKLDVQNNGVSISFVPILQKLAPCKRRLVGTSFVTS